MRTDAPRTDDPGATRVLLKLATSLDGKIATAQGESQWITGPESRRLGHELRAQSHAVLIGSQTALADDPQLTVRLEGHAGAQPMRVVADARLRTPLSHGLVTTASAETPTLIITRRDSAPRRTNPFAPNPTIDRYVAAGVKVGFADPGPNEIGLDPTQILARIRFTLETVIERVARDAPVTVMLEGGGRLAAAFLRAGLVDEIAWFRAPIVLGDDARSGIGPLAIAALSDAVTFTRTETVPLGADLLERYLCDTSKDATKKGASTP